MSDNRAGSGKCALVTGGTGGLGKVIVARFLQEGMRVAITYRKDGDLASLPSSVRSTVVSLKADVSLESDVQKTFAQARSAMGGTDIVVHTVGGFLPRKAFADVSMEEWDRMQSINLKTTFLVTREAVRSMKGQPYGRIINFSAMVGINPTEGRIAYALSKSGVMLLTELVGGELKGTGITVNAIAPSIIDTAANRESMPGEDYGRWVKPENIADMILYLCSDSAKDVTGTTFRARGGL